MRFIPGSSPKASTTSFIRVTPGWCRPITLWNSNSSAVPIRNRPIRVSSRRKETRIGRFRIGTADELEFHNVMGRHHPGVTRMKLVVEAFGLEPGMNRIYAVGDNQR